MRRSLTGDGVRATLDRIGDLVGGLDRHEVPSGTQALDWVVPDEWNLRTAYIEDADGRRVLDTDETSLHVVGYSEPIDAVVEGSELDAHLHSLPEQPDAVPYVTSYYRRTWGFCLSEHQRRSLGDGPFRVVIDATLEPGHLSYGELVLPGDTTDEVLLSTYVCHPQMANNELSGPVVATALARWLRRLPRRRYTYRLLFAPETIGAIVYLSRHLDHLRRHVRAGWVLTCLGDDRTYSYVPSRLGGTLADRVSLTVLDELPGGYDRYSFLERGSDERQWCSPGADLPVCSIQRSKYHTYPEYHTSLDDLDLVTPSGLQGGFDVLRSCIELLEANDRWVAAQPGEPQLGRRGLYPTTSRTGATASVKPLTDVLAYCDGHHDVMDLTEVTGLPWRQVVDHLDALATAGVVRRAES
ncbi:MAG: DUF4910 domain-containing protein [Acidimicrobiia bacterium]|nr:DUF4910 domain-containing protein [Acidimicrobiia bacterium]